MAQDEHVIPVLVNDGWEDVSDGPAKGGVFRPQGETVVRGVSVTVMKESLQKIVDGVFVSFAHLKAVGGFRLKEVEVEVEVSASGGVALIGTATVGGKGAIKLKFSE